jgi:nucleoside-diphosphate-sugar epimerase
MDVSDIIRDRDDLEQRLSEPTPAAVEALGQLEGDIIVLGAAGKMGPTLARMARWASDAAGVPRRILAVARFASAEHEEAFRRHGVEPVRCDLLEPEQLNQLPDVANVLYLVGRKFGSTGGEALTWAVNTFLPGVVCRRFARSRFVALSTGNVYGLTPIEHGGSREDDPLEPRGEYAMSCLGRERILEHFSRTLGIPMAIIRLNYACEMRYGVLVDLAQSILAGEPIDLAMGHFNVIWQADASAMALAAFAHASAPPRVFNVTGPEILSVRAVAEALGQLLDRRVTFQGGESPGALLSDSTQARRLLGAPRVGAQRLIAWTADWLKRGGPTLGKPTHFEVRDGRF